MMIVIIITKNDVSSQYFFDTVGNDIDHLLDSAILRSMSTSKATSLPTCGGILARQWVHDNGHQDGINRVFAERRDDVEVKLNHLTTTCYSTALAYSAKTVKSIVYKDMK